LKKLFLLLACAVICTLVIACGDTARIKLLPPQALLARLSQRLQMLTGGARDAPARQQTLRNAIEWSYQLLDTQEQRLFQRLSVFVGGCTLEAIERHAHARAPESRNSHHRG
jgi:predicted ATPase